MIELTNGSGRCLLVLGGLSLVTMALAFGPSHAQSGHHGKDQADSPAKLFASSCAHCHLPPDPTQATDLAWLGQVSDTAWSSTPPEARAAMIEYLRGKPLTLPAQASRASEAGQGEFGTVSVNFERGELLLVGSEGKAYRLSWSGDEVGDEHLPSLPPGEYSLRTYRLVREAAGELWHVSGTAASIQKISVKQDENVALEIDERIRIRPRLHGNQVLMDIKGHGTSGLSIFHKGKRIPIRYRVLDKSGGAVASGSMRYGWGGGGWAPVEPDTRGRVELVYDKPPFEVKTPAR